MDQSWNGPQWPRCSRSCCSDAEEIRELNEGIHFLELEKLKVQYERDLFELRLRWSSWENYDFESQECSGSETRDGDTDQRIQRHDEYVDLYDGSEPDLIDVFSEPPLMRFADRICEPAGLCVIDVLLTTTAGECTDRVLGQVTTGIYDKDLSLGDDVVERLVNLCKSTVDKTISTPTSAGCVNSDNQDGIKDRTLRKRREKKKRLKLRQKQKKKHEKDRNLWRNNFQSTSPQPERNERHQPVSIEQTVKSDNFLRRIQKRRHGEVATEARDKNYQDDDAIKLRTFGYKYQSKSSVMRENARLIYRVAAKDLMRPHRVIKFYYKCCVFCKMKNKTPMDARPLRSPNKKKQLVKTRKKNTTDQAGRFFAEHRTNTTDLIPTTTPLQKYLSIDSLMSSVDEDEHEDTVNDEDMVNYEQANDDKGLTGKKMSTVIAPHEVAPVAENCDSLIRGLPRLLGNSSFHVTSTEDRSYIDRPDDQPSRGNFDGKTKITIRGLRIVINSLEI